MREGLKGVSLLATGQRLLDENSGETLPSDNRVPKKAQAGS
jgi:hypothetical protein